MVVALGTFEAADAIFELLRLLQPGVLHDPVLLGLLVPALRRRDDVHLLIRATHHQHLGILAEASASYRSIQNHLRRAGIQVRTAACFPEPQGPTVDVRFGHGSHDQVPAAVVLWRNEQVALLACGHGSCGVEKKRGIFKRSLFLSPLSASELSLVNFAISQHGEDACLKRRSPPVLLNRDRQNFFTVALEFLLYLSLERRPDLHDITHSGCRQQPRVAELRYPFASKRTRLAQWRRQRGAGH
mmetsp:Transcript_48080/g.121205  ORF Transcript_48080/g.121205 Transcript_48080/m.121205 type:complete len:243 (-) Transcript_48080:103-831(-)